MCGRGGRNGWLKHQAVTDCGRTVTYFPSQCDLAKLYAPVRPEYGPAGLQVAPNLTVTLKLGWFNNSPPPPKKWTGHYWPQNIQKTQVYIAWQRHNISKTNTPPPILGCVYSKRVWYNRETHSRHTFIEIFCWSWSETGRHVERNIQRYTFLINIQYIQSELEKKKNILLMQFSGRIWNMTDLYFPRPHLSLSLFLSYWRTFNIIWGLYCTR